MHPRTIISIAIHIQCDEGSALAACINAVTLALVDAGVPMHDLVSAVTGGFLGPAAFTQPGQLFSQQDEQAEERLLALDLTRYEEGLPRAPRPAPAVAVPIGAEMGAGSGSGSELQAEGNTEGDEAVDTGFEEDADVTGMIALLRAQEAARPRTTQLHALATVAYTSTGLGEPEHESSPAAPTALDMIGSIPYPHLLQLLDQTRAAAAMVMAFLRLALRQKVLKDAVNFESSMSMSVAELGGAHVGPPRPAPAAAEGGAQLGRSKGHAEQLDKSSEDGMES
jgi:hypothetical protein